MNNSKNVRNSYNTQLSNSWCKCKVSRHFHDSSITSALYTAQQNYLSGLDDTGMQQEKPVMAR
jgi:hypothetical protein